MPPAKSLIIKLKVASEKLKEVADATGTTEARPSAKPEKPKKEKKEKKPAEPKEPKEPKPPKEKKEPKKTKKQLAEEAAAAAPTPETSKAKPIKIKFNINKLPKPPQAEESTPQTPSTARAAAELSSQALTSAPTQAPQITSPRPPQLASLPPIQTKVVSIGSTPNTATGTPGVPKIRLKTSLKPVETPKTPIIKLKNNASRPTANTRRTLPLGYGYDSEASDREEDPCIEEQFVLRMPPGEDADFIRAEIEKKEFGKSTDVWFKFKDDRRAIVSVRGKMYSATLVDLPCILESSKTIDKGKNIFKTADISQMLLVGDRLIIEDQALSNAVPPSLINYPHGITPPMQHVRRRRFRKRVVNRNMDKVEEAVERLLAADMEAEKVTYDLLTEAELARQTSEVSGDGEFGEEDAEGEEVDEMEYEDDEDAEGHEGMGMELDDFEDQLAEAMMDDEPAPEAVVHTQATTAVVSSDEDEEDDDDDDDDDADDMDVDPGTTSEQLQLKEEISDLERAINAKTKEREGVHNQIVKERIQKVIDGLKAELDLKKVSLGGM